jgi:CheY-like chemotaxis protein
MPEEKLIMVIDDDPDDKDIFVEIVNEIDPEYKCIWGRDGRDGINKLLMLSSLPRYIFLDLNMPRMNGKQCLAEIRNDPRFSNIPVIIYSTSKLDTDISETKLLGASYYMTKPSRFAELKEALAELFSGQLKQPAGKKNILLEL